MKKSIKLYKSQKGAAGLEKNTKPFGTDLVEYVSYDDESFMKTLYTLKIIKEHV